MPRLCPSSFWPLGLSGKPFLQVQTIRNSSQVDRPEHPEQSLHHHSCYEMMLVTKGERIVFYDDAEHRVGAGSLVVLPPGQPHCDWGGSKRISHFLLRGDAGTLSADEFGPPAQPLVARLTRPAVFVALVNRMAQEDAGSREGRDVLLRALLVEFLVLLRRDLLASAESPEAHRERQMRRLRSILAGWEDNAIESFSVKAVAQGAFMSQSAFSRRFRKLKGESPKQFQIRQRIESAKRLLRDTDWSATEIATRLGYRTPLYFYRQFKRQTGMTATEFRNRKSTPHA